MNRISSGYSDYNRYQNSPLSDDKSLLAVAQANQQAALKNERSIAGDYEEQVSVSDETRKKLASLNLAKLLGKQVPGSESTEQSEKVSKLKALFAQDGGIQKYLAGLDTQEVAKSILEHPLAPKFV